MKKYIQIKHMFLGLCASLSVYAHAHVILQSVLQQPVKITVSPLAGQSATCAKKDFDLAPFSRVQLSAGDGSYPCKAITIKINSQGPQTADFSSIDQAKNDVIIQVVPGTSSLNVQVAAAPK